jgi:hypothetical protein
VFALAAGDDMLFSGSVHGHVADLGGVGALFGVGEVGGEESIVESPEEGAVMGLGGIHRCESCVYTF